MADKRDPEELSEAEIEDEAAREQPDPITAREAMEEDLIAEGRSDEGEDIGEPTS